MATLHWEPTLQYHQHRLDPIEALEGDGSLRSFRVEPKEVGARTERAQLMLSASGLVLQSSVSLLTDENCGLVRLALEAVKPRHFRKATVLYQFVIPLDASYDDARRAALGRLTNDTFSPFGAYDFAMLVEGKGSSMNWHVEFGIVSGEEIVPRLRRLHGHFREEHGFYAPTVPEPQPAVAFYADSHWESPHFEPGQDPVQAVIDLIRSAELEVDKVIGELYGHLFEADENRAVAGGTSV
jgi:hypothetical protein